MIKKNTELKEILKLTNDCKCEACESGCGFGSGILIEGEEKKIAEFLGISEEELKKKYLEEVEEFNKKFLRPKIKRGEKPYGPCIFFDEKQKCKIHKVKSMQCKLSMSCKPYGEDLMLWFMLNHIIDKDDPESIRQFASYLTSGGRTLEGGHLEELVPDKEKLNKILKFEILK
ncbi:YkgJ family cysteine cluster protein [Candidatus Woesearchaeota archaeon]|nr:YkgJ family cysteine cluster protein [Candidatus Woesearchaeota archaeon]